MKSLRTILLLCLILIFGFVNSSKAQILSSEFNGRIAWSCDGNDNDEDDWSASPMALNIFAAYNLKDKLVHFHYNNILESNRENWEEIHKNAVLKAAELNKYDPLKFYNIQTDKEAAINDIARLVNESSEENPLYFVLAGPMDVPAMGIEKSNPEKRKFVYCISHSNWNDGVRPDAFEFIKYNKRTLIEQGVNWIQIKDQNQFTSTTRLKAGSVLLKPEERRVDTEKNISPWYWLRDSKDPRLRHVWDMFQVELRPDCSDSGMAYFLATGDENATIEKIRKAIEFGEPNKPLQFRPVIRIEAENFRILEDFKLDVKNERAASHRVSVLFTGNKKGKISTRFNEMRMKEKETYKAEVRYFSGTDSNTSFSFLINNTKVGKSWKAREAGKWESRRFEGVNISKGDNIQLKISSKKDSGVKLDFVELNNIP